MNNQGWGLRAMFGFCLIIALCLIIVIVLYNKNLKNILNNNTNKSNINNNFKIDNSKKTINNYSNYEQQIVESAKKYVEKYYNEIDEDISLIVTLKSLEEENMLTSIKDLHNNKCSGYVKITAKKYQSFIKCGNKYTTSGYLSRFDDVN